MEDGSQATMEDGILEMRDWGWETDEGGSDIEDGRLEAVERGCWMGGWKAGNGGWDMEDGRF